VKKIVLAGTLVVVLLLVVGFGYAAYLLRSLNTPEFKKTLLERAKATVGTDVQVKDMEISVLSGVTLKGVTVGNPAGFPGDLLKADAFVLRYRLRSLLSGQLEVEQLVLEKPVVNLAMNARGSFNYEKLGGGSKAAPAKSPPSGASMAASPIELILRKLAVQNAEMVMKDATEAPLMRVQDFDLESAFKVTGAAAQGSGTARIATLSLADLMFVRGISAPIEMSKESVKLAPIRGKLAGGDLAGDVNVNLKDGFRYTASLDVKGTQVQKLLEEAKSKRAVSGTLVAQAIVEGSGGLPTMKGKGKAEIADCKVSDMPVFGAVAAALRIPELSNPSFDQCRIEFVLGASRLQMPVISLKGRQVQLTGRGTTNLDTYGLDYDLNLALARSMLDKVSIRELKAAFKEREDGFSTVDFKVTGTSTMPQTDLASKVGKAAATEAATGALKKLFGKKKP
jgi:uncharacterized protein involved in outer membrane biogenesis